MHAKILCYTRCSVVQELSNKQSTKVICRLTDLENQTERDRKAI